MYTDTTYLAYELRDGLLQDLVATGLLIEAARRALRDEAGVPDTGAGGAPTADRAEALLARAAETLEGDLASLRSVIDRLRPAA